MRNSELFSTFAADSIQIQNKMRKLFLICALISAFAFTAKSENIKSTTRSSNNNTKDVPVSADVISDTINLDEVTVTSLYRNNVNVGYLVDNKTLISENYGQYYITMFYDNEYNRANGEDL